MAFNHYAKMKRILIDYPGWYVVRINEPTSSLSFKGERREFDHYYRVYSNQGEQIKYCKFQQLDRFAQAMGIDSNALPVTEDVHEVPVEALEGAQVTVTEFDDNTRAVTRRDTQQ